MAKSIISSQKREFSHADLWRDVRDVKCKYSSNFVLFCRFKYYMKLFSSFIVYIIRGIFYFLSNLIGSPYYPDEANVFATITFILFVAFLVVSSLALQPDFDRDAIRVMSIILYVALLLFSLGMMTDDGEEKDNIIDFISFIIIAVLCGVAMFSDFVGADGLPIVGGVVFFILIFHYFKKNKKQHDDMVPDIVTSGSIQNYLDNLGRYLEDPKINGGIDENYLTRANKRLDEYKYEFDNKQYGNAKKFYRILMDFRNDIDEIRKKGLKMNLSTESYDSFAAQGIKSGGLNNSQNEKNK